MLTDTECRVSNAGLCMSFIQPHSAAPSPYSVYKEGFQQKEEYIFYTYASAHFQRFMLRRPPSHSDLGLKCFDKGAALTQEGDKLLGATPCTRTHVQTHTEAHGNEDNLLHKSYTQPGVRFAEVGDVCGGRPSSARLAEDPEGFSGDEHSSKEISP